jgi:hypothetical protein
VNEVSRSIDDWLVFPRNGAKAGCPARGLFKRTPAGGPKGRLRVGFPDKNSLAAILNQNAHGAAAAISMETHVQVPMCQV